MQLKADEALPRLKEAFLAVAKETGQVPSPDMAVEWDEAQGHVPPLKRGSVYRWIHMALAESSYPGIETMHPAAAYAATIGIRSAVEVNGTIYTSTTPMPTESSYEPSDFYGDLWPEAQHQETEVETDEFGQDILDYVVFRP